MDIIYPLEFFNKETHDKISIEHPGITADFTDDGMAYALPICGGCKSKTYMYLKATHNEGKITYSYGCGACSLQSSPMESKAQAAESWAMMNNLRAEPAPTK